MPALVTDQAPGAAACCWRMLHNFGTHGCLGRAPLRDAGIYSDWRRDKTLSGFRFRISVTIKCEKIKASVELSACLHPRAGCTEHLDPVSH